MIGTVVVGFGEHNDATPALHWACDLADAARCELRVLSALGIVQPRFGRDWSERVTAQRRVAIADLLDRLSHPAAEVAVAADRPAVAAFGDYLRSHHADLLVLGTAGRPPRPRGGHRLAAALLARSLAPVALVRPGFATIDSGPVVLGLHRPHMSKPALRFAQTLSRRVCAGLRVILFDDVDDGRDPFRRRNCRTGEGRSAPAGYPRFETVHGDPVNAMIDIARACDAAAIVLGVTHPPAGGHDLDPLHRQLVVHLPTPLIIVPDPR